jgi:hypothetical protein
METPPIKLAFIIDNEVADILHTDERLAAIFLSNPTIIDITDNLNNNPASIAPGMIYNPETKEYIFPQQEDNNV